MSDTFQSYLLAKRSVDDRSLNRHVYAALVGHPVLAQRPLRVLEVGCGAGAMAQRLLAWGAFAQGAGVRYVGLDADADSIALAQELVHADSGVDFRFVTGDLLQLDAGAPTCDLVIAHAVLDLLHLPTALPILRNQLRPGGLAWLTINFDGITALEPPVDAALDAEIEALYHASMDARLTNGKPSGDSRTGRRLFAALPAAGFHLLAAGASDWVVCPLGGGEGAHYDASEADFLRAIVRTVAAEPFVQRAIAPDRLAHWLAQRLQQIDAVALTYIAHQLDFLVQRPPV